MTSVKKKLLLQLREEVQPAAPFRPTPAQDARERRGASLIDTARLRLAEGDTSGIDCEAYDILKQQRQWAVLKQEKRDCEKALEDLQLRHDVLQGQCTSRKELLKYLAGTLQQDSVHNMIQVRGQEYEDWVLSFLNWSRLKKLLQLSGVDAGRQDAGHRATENGMRAALATSNAIETYKKEILAKEQKLQQELQTTASLKKTIEQLQAEVTRLTAAPEPQSVLAPHSQSLRPHTPRNKELNTCKEQLADLMAEMSTLREELASTETERDYVEKELAALRVSIKTDIQNVMRQHTELYESEATSVRDRYHSEIESLTHALRKVTDERDVLLEAKKAAEAAASSAEPVTQPLSYIPQATDTHLSKMAVMLLEATAEKEQLLKSGAVGSMQIDKIVVAQEGTVRQVMEAVSGMAQGMVQGLVGTMCKTILREVSLSRRLLQTEHTPEVNNHNAQRRKTKFKKLSSKSSVNQLSKLVSRTMAELAESKQVSTQTLPMPNPVMDVLEDELCDVKGQLKETTVILKDTQAVSEKLAIDLQLKQNEAEDVRYEVKDLEEALKSLKSDYNKVLMRVTVKKQNKECTAAPVTVNMRQQTEKCAMVNSGVMCCPDVKHKGCGGVAYTMKHCAVQVDAGMTPMSIAATEPLALYAAKGIQTEQEHTPPSLCPSCSNAMCDADADADANGIDNGIANANADTGAVGISTAPRLARHVKKVLDATRLTNYANSQKVAIINFDNVFVRGKEKEIGGPRGSPRGSPRTPKNIRLENAQEEKTGHNEEHDREHIKTPIDIDETSNCTSPRRAAHEVEQRDVSPPPPRERNAQVGYDHGSPSHRAQRADMVKEEALAREFPKESGTMHQVPFVIETEGPKQINLSALPYRITVMPTITSGDSMVVEQPRARVNYKRSLKTAALKSVAMTSIAAAGTEEVLLAELPSLPVHTSLLQRPSSAPSSRPLKPDPSPSDADPIQKPGFSKPKPLPKKMALTQIGTSITNLIYTPNFGTIKGETLSKAPCTVHRPK